MYRFEWEEMQLDAIVERVHSHRDGRVTAEVVFTTSMQGVAPHLSQSQVNLLSGQAKKTLAAELDRRWPDQPWPDIVEQLCVITLQKHREGEPVQMLGGNAEVVELEWQLYPILLAHKPTVLFGDGGIGKSKLAAYFCLLIQRGLHEAGFRATPGQVLYLDWETDEEEQKRTLSMLQNGLTIEAVGDIAYRRCYAPLADDLQAIQRIVADKSIDYIVVDSLSGACGDDLTLQSVAAKFFQALAALRVGSLLITHTAKNQGEKATAFGSAYWRNYARSMFELKQNQEDSPNMVNLGLFHRKMNADTLQRPIGLEFRYNGAAAYVTRKDVRDMPGLESHLPNADRIWQVLSDGAKDVSVIAKAAGMSEAVTRSTLHRNTGSRFVRLSDGRFGRALRELDNGKVV